MKERIRNNILIKMQKHVDAQTLGILDTILVYEFQGVDIKPITDLPATIDDTNKYLINLFDVKKAPKLSKDTVYQYKLSIAQLTLLIDKPLINMTTMDIEYYLEQCKTKANNNTSINNQLANIRAFYTWMRKMRLVTFNPCESIEPYKQVTKPIDHMKAEEVEQLKTGCKYKRDRALIEFLRCTAMRGGEVPIVCINQIDFKSGSLTIFGRKGNAYRPVCLDSVALKYIEDYITDRGLTYRSEEPLFAHIRGNKTVSLGKEGILTSIKTIAKRSGLKRNVYTHLFRKTTATNIIKRGGSDELAGEYLGHKPASVTGRHYAYKSEDHVVKIFEQYVAAV